VFADDTSLGYANQDEDQIKYVINHDLHELGDWSKRWFMSFNPDKTEIMVFKNVENSTNLNFYFDGKLIPLTSDHKHLGITFSEEAKSDSTHHFFRNACTKSGSLRFSQFSGC
jgi:hypothetical protein